MRGLPSGRQKPPSRSCRAKRGSADYPAECGPLRPRRAPRDAAEAGQLARSPRGITHAEAGTGLVHLRQYRRRLQLSAALLDAIGQGAPRPSRGEGRAVDGTGLRGCRSRTARHVPWGSKDLLAGRHPATRRAECTHSDSGAARVSPHCLQEPAHRGVAPRSIDASHRSVYRCGSRPGEAAQPAPANSMHRGVASPPRSVRTGAAAQPGRQSAGACAPVRSVERRRGQRARCAPPRTPRATADDPGRVAPPNPRGPVAVWCSPGPNSECFCCVQPSSAAALRRAYKCPTRGPRSLSTGQDRRSRRRSSSFEENVPAKVSTSSSAALIVPISSAEMSKANSSRCLRISSWFFSSRCCNRWLAP